MDVISRLRQNSMQLRSCVYILYRGMRDTRVKWYVKILTMLVLAYVISPIDIIPDFIPVLGLLDELILVPIALSLIVRLIPDEILAEYQAAQQPQIKDRKLVIIGVLIVISIWILLIATGFFLMN